MHSILETHTLAYEREDATSRVQVWLRNDAPEADTYDLLSQALYENAFLQGQAALVGDTGG